MLDKSKYKQRILLLIAIVAVLYSALWYFASQFVQDKVVGFLAQAKDKENIIFCENVEKAGYPLRVGMSCNSFSFRQAPVGIAFNTDKLAITAPIYALNWAELSISSPASLQIPGLLPLAANWKQLKLVGEVNEPIPDQIAFSAEDISIAIKGEAGKEDPFFSASLLRFDAEGFNSNLTASLTFDKAQLLFSSFKDHTPLPSAEGHIQLKISNAYYMFDNNLSGIDDFRERLRNQEGVIERAEIRLASGGKFSLSGPFSVDQDGSLDANFDLAIGDQSALQNSARLFFPAYASNMDAIFFVINSMPKNEYGEPIFKITVKNSNARLGFIKLGRIPQL